MGQSTKSTRPGPLHTGRPHGHVNLAELKHDSHGLKYGHVLVESKLSPIQKRPLLRAYRHSKAYKYTQEEEKKETEKRG
ncbi:Putative arginine N-methyltransferase 10 [Gossypium arboreum]|uniref:Putative arginine N-methyltransferase 10 n=1 Tax=Gossypium arboreum TaxID=29729 RepID=A0A0B0NJ83_GOSAR|nr:Putative arginine N-methyltransferase 10 [Gossypium arboreum]